MPKKTKLHKKSGKTSSRQWRRRFFIGLIVAGVGMMGVGVGHRYLYQRSLSLQKEILASNQTLATNKVIPVRLKIWDMINIPVEAVPLNHNQWLISETGATYLAESAGIGEPGNMIIYGHNKREILGNIRVLKGGEKFTIGGSDGKQYQYQVSWVREVDPNETRWLQPTTTHALTIFTCSGLMDSRRFIVRAELRGEEEE